MTDQRATMSGNGLAMAEALRKRTKQFALRVINLSRTLPTAEAAKVISRQVIRSGTSVGANYRAVCRSRSQKDFVSKMSVVVEETDETGYWIELLIDSELSRAAELRPLLQECNELLAIFSKSLSTARANLRRGAGGARTN